MLPNHDGIFVEVRNIGSSDALGVLLHQHPTEMRVEESLSNAVGILLGIGVSVVGAVVASPPTD